mgnify:CR=1 FL=1
MSMDAIEFVKQLRRMDEKGVLKNHFIYPCTGRDTDSPKDVVTEVEEWAKMNPVKTRQSVFLEQYPEAEIDVNGIVQLCPMSISAAHRDSGGECKNPERLCRDCRREFWMQEVE